MRKYSTLSPTPQVIQVVGFPRGIRLIKSTGTMTSYTIVVLVAFALSTADRGNSARPPTQSAVPLDGAVEKPVVVIHAYDDGLSGVRAANPAVHLSVGRDPSVPDGPVLLVEYPPPTDDPAGRDVRCDAENQDWTAGGAISFQVKPAHALRLSLSFFDRNRVAYTAWTELRGNTWQMVRVPFDQIRPNPYFQRPDAKTGAPMDVSAVTSIAFAPQDRTSGRLAISRFVVVK